MAHKAKIIPLREPAPREDSRCGQQVLIMGFMELSDEADARGQVAIAQILLIAVSSLADRAPSDRSPGGRHRA